MRYICEEDAVKIMIKKAKTYFSAAAILATAWTAGGAAASELETTPPPAPGWTVSFTPYGWVTWLDGDQTVRGRTVSVQVDPIELIEDLNRVPFMGYGEARKGPFAFYGDLVYASIGLGGDSVRTRSNHPLINGTVSASVGLDYKLTIAEAGAVYQVMGGQTSFDVLAGARYWHQEADIDFALSATLDVSDLVVSRGVAISRSGSVDWVDPVVGARIRHQIAPGQELMLRGDVGGFGAGSQFSWNILAAYNFEICASDGVTYSGVLGYRLLDVDYEQGSGRTRYEYDMLQHGPLSGLTIRF